MHPDAGFDSEQGVASTMLWISFQASALVRFRHPINTTCGAELASRHIQFAYSELDP
jgi:hypothetical protein